MEVFLGIYWRARPITLGEYLRNTKDYLRRLQEIHPIFRELYDVGRKPNAETAIAPDLNNFYEVAREKIYNKENEYSHTDVSGHPTLDATCEFGYSLMMSNKNSAKEGKVCVSVGAGSSIDGLFNTVIIDFPEYQYPEFINKPLSLDLLKASIECWSPESGLVTNMDFFYLTYDNWDSLPVGWMTYSDNPSVCQLLPPHIQCERFGPGSLITVSEEVSSVDNPEHVEKALAISNCLAGHVSRR
ncbi:Imm52 family immunity protein [Pseudomonas triclosanedens]|uniref:Imm52 family immunity protein n=1 Tax=Pseudomonas triclosanedens TaxID=2961893 RepID=A0ABY6ZXB3_9PSED|nr:Imm52 family immunity protein [Pseudomonas triclosanedens]WAI49632.1 Imm52 family immunity protein [Pseudomonas triclosanedens]